MYTKELKFKILEANLWSGNFEKYLQDEYDILHEKGAKILDVKFLTTPDHSWSHGIGDGYGDGNGTTTVEYSAIIYYIPDFIKEKEYIDKVAKIEKERKALEEEEQRKAEAKKPINWDIPVK